MIGICRLAMTALVPADATELCLQGFDLRIEHAAIHEQAVGEHDGRAASARVFIIDVLAVDRSKRHVVVSLLQ